MTIHNFESFVEKKILERGSSYYYNECVEELEQFDRGEFSAIVNGSEDYEVFVKLDETQTILESHCDCPYDWGDVCKHEVAVYYKIKTDQLYKKELSPEAVNLMYKIDEMNIKELKSYLHKVLKKDSEWRADFLTNK